MISAPAPLRPPLRWSCLAWLLSAAVACGGDGPAQDQGPEYSLGTCPLLEAGVQQFASGDLIYPVTIYLPEEPVGAPLAFAFHGLNGTAEQISTRLEVDRLVAIGAIVVAPQSSSPTADYEWEFLLRPEVNPDLRLFYDLLGCARRQFDIDMDRIWTTGMSAGGLWSSYLVLNASEWITAAAPFSGGVIGQVPYPERRVPVMLTWGGPEDTYAGFDFDAASRDLAFYLKDFGNPLVQCVDDFGHAVPPEAGRMLETFLGYQRWGDPDPFAAGLPAAFPYWCSRP